MKLAIIASETFNDKELLLEKIEESQADYLLSGDENNIEKLITEVAESLHLHKHIFSTDVQKHGSEVSVINLKAIVKSGRLHPCLLGWTLKRSHELQEPC